jgi:hypothetical protein
MVPVLALMRYTDGCRTSQWASVDIGLIHFAVLDLDPGPPPVFAPGGAQEAWLEADLKAAAANRDRVPWIVVGSHFPLYSGRFEEEGATNASLSWYAGSPSNLNSRLFERWVGWIR